MIILKQLREPKKKLAWSETMVTNLFVFDRFEIDLLACQTPLFYLLVCDYIDSADID
jgi:hypothetical protein